ncbi:MAG: hypothetical protein U9M97_00270 [Candidatus Hadarchaeota archaeon]|nr:hypothetical protein [Candidatus Hadarchaeota archaeon]
MFGREGFGRRWITDAIFAVILAIWFVALYFNFSQRIRPEVGALFAASYVLIGTGDLVFYLLSGMNYRLASLVHAGTLPFVGIFYLFGRWMPDVIPKVGGIEVEFSLGILVYVLVLIAFLVVQLVLHLSEPEPERMKQFKRLAL